MYMTFSKAQRLTQEDYSKYTDPGKLQKKCVLLLDALLRADSVRAQENGLLKSAIEGGFFADATTQSTTGIVPRDMWLAQNLKTALAEAYKRFSELTKAKNNGQP